MDVFGKIDVIARILGRDAAMDIVRLRSHKQDVDDGGAGSGNFGHKGRAGKRGGSSKRGQGGGAQHIKRQAMSAAKKADNDKFRKVVSRALGRLPVGTYLSTGKQDDTQDIWYKGGDGLWRASDGDDSYTDQQMANATRFDKQSSFYRMSTAGQKQQYDDDRKAYEGASKVRQRVNKLRQAAKDWKSKVPQQYMDSLGGLTRRFVEGYQPSQALKKNKYSQNAYFKAMAIALDWQSVCKQGKFDLLTKEQKDTLNLLRNKGFQISKEQYGNQGQDSFLNNCSGTIRDMYDSLMAKALGVQITAPAIDASLVVNYLRQHPDYKPVSSLENRRGYTFTGGSDRTIQFRQDIKRAKAFDSVPAQHKHYIDAIVDKVSQIDQDVMPHVIKCFNDLSIDWHQQRDNGDGGGNCCYTPGSNTITMSRCFADGYQRSPQQFAETFWHQFGHYFDDVSSKDQKIPNISIGMQMVYSIDGIRNTASLNGAYNKAAKADVQHMLKLIGRQSDTILHADGHTPGGVSVSENGMQWHDFAASVQYGHMIHDYMMEHLVTQMGGYDWAYTQGFPKQVDHNDYYEMYVTPKRRTVKRRWKFKGAEQAYQRALWKRDEQIDKFVAQHPGFYDQMDKHAKLRSAQQKQVNQLCDMIGQMSLGTILPVLGGTHSQEYYRRKNSPCQTTAQVFSFLAMGKSFTLKCMQQLMPETYQLMMNAIKYRGA